MPAAPVLVVQPDAGRRADLRRLLAACPDLVFLDPAELADAVARRLPRVVLVDRRGLTDETVAALIARPAAAAEVPLVFLPEGDLTTCETLTAIAQDVYADAAMLRELAELSPAMMWVTGPDNLCQWVNRACLEYTGRTLEQEQGLGWAEFVHPDDRAACLQAVEAAFERREPYEIEYRVMRADGQYRWILDRARPRRDPRGAFAGYVGTAFDVTGRRLAEDAIERSEARYHAIFATSVECIVVLDDDGRCVEVNDAFCRMLDRARDDLAGRPFTDFVAPSLHDEALAAFARLREQGRFSGEFPLLARDGAVVELEWASRASFAPGLHLCVAREITDRKRAERATRLLVQAGQLLSASLDVEASLSALVRCSTDEVADVAFVHLATRSHPARLVTAHDRDADRLRAVSAWLAAQGPGRFVPAAGDAVRLERVSVDGVGPLRLLRIPLSSGGDARGELTLATTGGETRLGEPELEVGAELARRASAALEHARLFREAQEANRLKDEFLATLSHELRTPLNAIVGWSHVLQQGTADLPTVVRAAEIIARNAQAQVQLISDLLDVSRIAAGKLRLEPGVVQLHPVVEAALDAIRPAAEARQLTLLWDLDPEADALWGDADRLQQVTWNLLTNAIKFTPRGGTVEVRLRRDGDDLELTVRDDGAGIDPAFLPYVFERFRQADSSTTRPHGGLGLGMAIVRHLVEAHGGSVSAANREDRRGALFTVRLPRNLPHAAAAVPVRDAAGGAASLSGLRVLVVDDEEDSREVVCAVLAGRGAQVLSAASAAEAMDLIRRERPHVLLADIQMPGEDGYALLRRLRALPADQGGLLPAAALSAYAGPEHRKAALLAGFQVHLAKPVMPADVVSVVVGLATRQRP